MRERFVRFAMSAAIIAGTVACDGTPYRKNTRLTPVATTPIAQEIPVQSLPEQPHPLPDFGEPVKRVAVAETISVFEQESGKKKLSFEEAAKFAPLVARLYRESAESPVITEEIKIFVLEGARDTIVRTEQMSLTELEELPIIKKLRLNYSGASFSEEELRRIVRSRRSVGFVEESKVFINLDEVNGTSVTAPTYPDWPRDQYFDISLNPTCLPLGPASSFRATLLHELAHRDVLRERFEVDPEIANLIRRARGWILPVEPVEQYGFGIVGRIVFEEGTVSQVPIPLYEEIGADYIAAAVSVVNDLGFISNDYSNPSGLYNFRQVLVQAHISDQTFVTLHRNYALKELLQRIGESALAVNPSTDDPLEVAFTIANNGFATLNVNWSPVLPYFPTTTLKQYQCK